MTTPLTRKQDAAVWRACTSSQGFIYDTDRQTLANLVRARLVEKTGLGTTAPEYNDVRYRLSTVGLRYAFLRFGTCPSKRIPARVWVVQDQAGRAEVFDNPIAADLLVKALDSEASVQVRWVHQSLEDWDDGNLADALASLPAR